MSLIPPVQPGRPALIGWLLVLGALLCLPAGAQSPEATAAARPRSVVRRVVMKDPQSVAQFKSHLDSLKSGGLFRFQLPGGDPKQPRYDEISFLLGGNHLLVVGDREWVDEEIGNIQLMAFLFERPRAHLQLNLRVVQLTGPANADVIQMTEAVRTLVNTQRAQVVRAFADLEAYLTERLRQREGPQLAVYQEVRRLLPSLAAGDRPLTVPEILLLLMLDQSSPALPPPAGEGTAGSGSETEAALLALPKVLGESVRDPLQDDAAIVDEIAEELETWKAAVARASDWCAHYARELDRENGIAVGGFLEALELPDCPLPSWIRLRLRRSLHLTERLYPNLIRKHMEESLRELDRRFRQALQRAEQLEAALARGLAERDKGKKRKLPESYVGQQLLALKSLADELVPLPLALFEAVVAAADDSAPTPEQLIDMFREYNEERLKVDRLLLVKGTEPPPEVNYEKLQALEANLNLWLRRASEALARALEQQFYNRYVDQLRLLANKQLGKTSSRDILSATGIDDVADIARDLLLADTGVNVFVSNSVSLQFAPGTTNSVSAQVQAKLPSNLSLLERVQQAGQAANTFQMLQQQYGIGGEAIIKALLAGGQAVPVQAGINLSANPTIGFDASTVSLTLTANQTLQPESSKIADRVTNHSINNATVTVLAYEPMVLSTLASNISYYESTGGIPILRKTPLIKDLLKDIPIAPFKQGRRQKGVYQSSVIILEPTVIPTIDDLVSLHSGWRREINPTVVP